DLIHPSFKTHLRNSMPLRLKCRCGQLLQVPEQAAGQVTRCPNCQTLLTVPAAAAPAQPQMDLFADLPPAQLSSLATSVPRPPQTPLARPQRAVRQGGGSSVILAALLVAGGVSGLLAIGGAVIWWALPVLSRGENIAANFTPVAPLASDGEL